MEVPFVAIHFSRFRIEKNANMKKEWNENILKIYISNQNAWLAVGIEVFCSESRHGKR